MKLQFIHELKTEVAVLLISLLLASTILLVFKHFRDAANDKKSITIAELNSARDRYYAAIHKKNILETFEIQYEKLKNNGFIGDEDRINWVNTIENITRNYKIPYLKYKINQRTLFTSIEFSQHYPDIDLFLSRITLQMQLLHEGDLVTVLNKLQHAKGVFDIYSCDIQKNPTQIENIIESVTDRNFSATCILNWYTLNKKPNNQPLGQDI